MNTIKTTDKRIESKYITDSVRISEFYMLLNNFGFRNSYAPRSVFSLYYDDELLTSVKDNLAGITPRSKYRLRWYKSKDQVYYGWQFEKKVKNGLTGYKEIESIINAIDLCGKEISLDILSNIKNHSKFTKHLRPILICNYYRHYYDLPSGQRLTIDKKIMFRRFHKKLNLNSSFGWAKSNYNIIEIKFQPSDKTVLTSLFKKLPISSSRCSKYLLGQSKLNGITYI